MNQPSHNDSRAQIAAYIDRLTLAIRANANGGLPEDKPGMDRAANLLSLHKTRVLAGEEQTWLAPVLNALSAAAEDQAAIQRAHVLARRWGVLRAYGGAATELRTALMPGRPIPAGFTRVSLVTVSCACCQYTHDEDESFTVTYESVQDATQAVQDVGWTVLEDGRVLCDSEDDEHQALRDTQRTEQPAVGEGQQTIEAVDQQTAAPAVKV